MSESISNQSTEPKHEDVFRKEYTTVNGQNKDQILLIKNLAEDLYVAFNAIPPGREISLARTKLEESVMWAVKAATDPKHNS